MCCRRFVVAIDGPAGAGKSTVAKLLARHLGWLHIDTGAMYRAVALKALRMKVPLDDEGALATIASSVRIEFSNSPDGIQRVLLDGEDVTEAIRTPDVDEAVSVVSAHSAVRRIMQGLQRKLVEGVHAIAEGRDMQTVVFPDAELKIFLTASLEERAKRRWLELKSRGYDVTLEEELKRTEERDRLDATRVDSPLAMASDAVVIDTTHMTPQEVVEHIIALIAQRLRRHGD
ncbi:MAG: (d)CMP kinase [Armatimonadota bacterium]|nr:(d)CMP kinase [Armatimonadota bacterium]MCX7777399.1 (d)CMP kinase [Armatimonadota bacterium]MDW8025068.1 (d)CMP kinase [Armatimonadota bacterium]